MKLKKPFILKMINGEKYIYNTSLVHSIGVFKEVMKEDYLEVESLDITIVDNVVINTKHIVSIEYGDENTVMI